MEPEELLHELLERWREQTEAGQSVSAAELCKDHPQLLPELLRRIQIAEHLQQLAAQVELARGGIVDTAPPAGAPTEVSPPGSEGVMVPADLAPLEPGSEGELGRLGRFRILEVLGKGGMGLVLRAEDSVLRRPVAIKLLKGHLAAEPASRERFLREARAAARLEHPHVVAIHHVDEAKGVPYLVMPLLKGEPLDRRLARTPRPDLLWVLRVGRQMAEGLAAAHAAGLVHRDIKPANVWLKSPDDAVVLLDFGLARAEQGEVSITRSGDVLGTPAYMAPEQADARPVDHRTDLFSLGCVLYEMASGRRPYSGKNQLTLIRQLATHTPTPVAELVQDFPAGLGELIGQLLEKAPEARPSSAQEVAARLGQIGQALRPETATKPSESKLWYQIVMLVGVLTALVFSLIQLVRFLSR